MYNYVSASQDLDFIQTPDNYRPDKLDESVTLDQIQEQCNTHPIYESSSLLNITQWILI